MNREACGLILSLALSESASILYCEGFSPLAPSSRFSPSWSLYSQWDRCLHVVRSPSAAWKADLISRICLPAKRKVFPPTHRNSGRALRAKGEELPPLSGISRLSSPASVPGRPGMTSLENSFAGSPEGCASRELFADAVASSRIGNWRVSGWYCSGVTGGLDAGERALGERHSRRIHVCTLWIICRNTIGHITHISSRGACLRSATPQLAWPSGRPMARRARECPQPSDDTTLGKNGLVTTAD